MSTEIWANGGLIASRVFHQYDNDNNGADLAEPPKLNFTERGGAASTSVKCVKRWRALVDYGDPCMAGTRKGASAPKVRA